MDGSTDDEKTEHALESIEENDLDLLFVHYKDVDKTGHNYGDMHVNTMEDIKKIDSYVEKILKGWDGYAIIYADHGMHATEEGGDHKHLITEDMFMPYWLYNVGENQ